MSFPLLKLTNAGRQLIIKALSGDCSIVFTKIGVGNGAPPNDINSITALMNTIKTVSINTITQGEGCVTLSVTLDNTNLQAGFWWKEVGVYATDPDDGEVLYAYAHSGDLADFIPAFTTQNYLRTTINLTVVVGDAENVSAVIGEYVGYATTEEFDEHKNDTTNPHRVTAAQVGLGNVPNVATNDQQPTFSAANSVVEINSGESLSLLLGKIKTAIAALISHFNANNPHNVTKAQVGLGNVPNLSTNDQTPTYTEASTLSDLTSGENLGAAFGKIKKAISSLISHLSNTSNPHNVTAQQAGASAVGHSHTTSDITSGTLPVERGGTGVSDETSLKNLIFSKKYGSITFQTGYKPYDGMTNQILVMQVGKTIMVDATIWADSAFPSSRTKIAKINGVTLPIFTEKSLCDTNNRSVYPEEFHPSKFEIDTNGYIWIHSNGTDNQAHIHMVYMTN